MIDSHAHLDDPRYDADRHEVIQRAIDSGVEKIVTIGCDLKTSRAAVEIADQTESVYATVGIHPHETAHADQESYEGLRQLAAHPKVVAWGETGLDYHYMNSPKEDQIRAFREQIRFAGQLDLPLVIHTREADDDTIRILSEERSDRTRGVFHCFSGNLALAQQALEMDFLISISGMITFDKALELQNVARQIPPDRLLIETDCPYLTPVPNRGKRNEPSFVRYVAKKIAQIHPSIPYEAIIRNTSKNARQLFGFS